MKQLVIRNWRTGTLRTVSRRDDKVFIGFYMPSGPHVDHNGHRWHSHHEQPALLWRPSDLTDEEANELKRRFLNDYRTHRTTVLPDDPPTYTFKAEAERELSDNERIIAELFDVPPSLIWGGARAGGKMSRSAEIARRMQELSMNGNVYWASKDGATLEEFLAKHPKPSVPKPKLDRRKKRRK